MAKNRIRLTQSDPTRPYDSGSVYGKPAYDETYEDAHGRERVRHHGETYIGSVSVVDSTGKRQRRTVTGKTPAEAERKLRKLTKLKHREELPTGSRKTLQWLRDEWLKTKAHREAQTRHFCEHKSALYVLPQLGHLTLKHLDAREVKGTLQAWVNDLAKVKHLSPKTVKHARDILRGILRYGIESGYLTHDATKKLELPVVSTGYRFDMLNDAAYGKLQTAANGQPLQAAYVLMFQHSMRPGEVGGVCWPDVDLERRTMTIRHSLEWLKDERRFNLKSIKNDVIETVDLTDAEVTLLKARRKQQFVERGRAGNRWQGSEWDLVFTTTTGAPFHHSGLYEPFVALLKRIGWTGHTRPYDMRHTGISWVEENYGMKAAQGQARHKQYSTTANFYVHLSRERKRAIATSMGGKVLPLSGTGS
jgi:integrase